jgi:anti-anti-sigma factor
VTIRERTIGSQTILDIHDKLVRGDTTDRLTDRINTLLAERRTDIVLNLDNLSYVDTSGLDAMLTLPTDVRKSGGELTINLTPKWGSSSI